MNSPVVPAHVGIIMDGNGRWASERNMPRSGGHREGLNSAKRIVKAASDLGIAYLSLYVFSTENWKRTEEEVSFLMGLLRKYLKAEYEFYKENKIRVIHSGDLNGLPADIRSEIEAVGKDTALFEGLTVNLCINYGGRDEILRAVEKRIKLGVVSPLTEKDLEDCLDHPELPPVDLVIRTAGEQRLSNFLLWQSAYAEYYSSEKYWPDWQIEDLEAALNAFQSRKRRYGGY